MDRTGNLGLDELTADVAAGSTDTVIVAFADMQGRLVGKRTSARLFLEDVATHGAEACNYLLAVDMDMNTVDGYAISSWERGYGDMVLAPRPRHPPAHPVAARHRARDGRPRARPGAGEDHGAPVSVSPRQILKRQIERLAALGLEPFVGTELEFIVFDDTYRDAWAKGYKGLTPASDYNIDYALLASTRMEPLLRDIRLVDGRRRHVLRGREGGVQPRPAGDRIPLRACVDDLRQPRALQERGEGDRRRARQGAHLHGEVQRARGQLLPHPPVGPRHGRVGGDGGRRRGRTASRR